MEDWESTWEVLDEGTTEDQSSKELSDEDSTIHGVFSYSLQRSIRYECHLSI